MGEFMMRYGAQCALIAAGCLALSDAVKRDKPGIKWYWRYIELVLGIVLLCDGIHMLLKSK